MEEVKLKQQKLPKFTDIQDDKIEEAAEGYVGVRDKHKDLTEALPADKGRSEWDIPGILRLLSHLHDEGAAWATLEKSHPMPQKFGGAISNFERGKSSGIWETALAALGIPHAVVTPQSWQKEMLKG